VLALVAAVLACALRCLCCCCPAARAEGDKAQPLVHAPAPGQLVYVQVGTQPDGQPVYAPAQAPVVYAQATYAQPAYAQPAYAQPGFAQPGYAQPAPAQQYFPPPQ